MSQIKNVRKKITNAVISCYMKNHCNVYYTQFTLCILEIGYDNSAKPEHFTRKRRPSENSRWVLRVNAHVVVCVALKN